MPQLIPVLPSGNHLLPTLGPAGLPASSPLPPASFGLLETRKPFVISAEAPLKPPFNICLDTLDRFDSTRETLDSLDTFVNGKGQRKILLLVFLDAGKGYCKVPWKKCLGTGFCIKLFSLPFLVTC